MTTQLQKFGYFTVLYSLPTHYSSFV